MKKMYYLVALLLAVSAAVVAQVDVPALKKSMQDDAAAVVKRMIDDAQKMSDNFKLSDALSEVIVKTYPKNDHESLRTEEEKRIFDRINAKAQKLTDEMSAAVEQAVVDAMKKQQQFEDFCKQDIAAFKQQFTENVQKMAQGKKATPITYSSSEGVVKGVSASEPKKSEVKKMDDFKEDEKLPDVVKKDISVLPKDDFGTSKSSPMLPLSIKSSTEVMSDGGANMGVSADASPVLPKPSKAEMSPKADKDKKDSKKADASKTESKDAAKPGIASKAQKDLLKMIRG